MTVSALVSGLSALLCKSSAYAFPGWVWRWSRRGSGTKPCTLREGLSAERGQSQDGCHAFRQEAMRDTSCGSAATGVALRRRREMTCVHGRFVPDIGQLPVEEVGGEELPEDSAYMRGVHGNPRPCLADPWRPVEER